jgi:hypothetical protein
VVTEDVEEGYKPLEVVREQMRPFVYGQKKAEYIKGKLEGVQAESLEAYKEAFGAGAYISQGTGAKFSSFSVPGIGQDPKLLGKLVSLKKGEISAPIEGNSGVYVVEITNVNQAAEPDSAALAQYRQQQIQQRRNQLINRFRTAMLEAAEIKDYRYNFGLN